MEVFYAAKAREDRAYWERKDKAIASRIDDLIADIQVAQCRFHYAKK